MATLTETSGMSYATDDDRQRLLSFLTTADEALLVEVFENALDARRNGPQGDDLTQALQEVDIKVRKTVVEKEWYRSKKLWAAMIAFGILVFDQLSTRQLWLVAFAPIAYMLSQGLADLGKNAK